MYGNLGTNDCVPGLSRVTDADQCKFLFNNFADGSYTPTFSCKNTLPNGCYWVPSEEALYFNPCGSSSGSAVPTAQPVCAITTGPPHEICGARSLAR